MKSARLLAFFALALLAAFATLPLWISAFIFRPAPLEKTDPRSWGLERARFVAFPAADRSRLTAWWMPPPKPEAPVVLLVHGRSANMASRAPIMRKLGTDGFGVLMFDYRGYGASAGRPDEGALTQDTLAAYRWLTGQGIAPGRIVLLGQSLGDAPAAQAAAQRRVAALVLVSPFTNLPEAAAERLPWLPLRMLHWSRNRYDVAASLRSVRAPLLFIASRRDGLVPMANSLKLGRTSPGRVRWLIDDRLPHDGLLAGVAADGRLSKALKGLLADGG
ncbi:MAG: hypothetical protein JWO81_647 [Alphaproteobacteria bacterium]|nr:hypothetical protein [Alphaproteobacteria bacterium]